MAPFYGWGSAGSRPQGDSLPFTIKFPEWYSLN